MVLLKMSKTDKAMFVYFFGMHAKPSLWGLSKTCLSQHTIQYPNQMNIKPQSKAIKREQLKSSQFEGYFHSTMLMQVLRKGFLSVKKNKERGGRGFPPVACNFFSFSLCFLFSSSSFMMNEAKAATPPPPPPDSILNLPNVKPSYFHKKEWNFTQKPEMRFLVQQILDLLKSRSDLQYGPKLHPPSRPL